MQESNEHVSIFIEIEPDLLEAVDALAISMRSDRSRVIGDALRRQLRRLRTQALVEKERRAFEEFPQTPEELEDCEAFCR